MLGIARDAKQALSESSEIEIDGSGLGGDGQKIVLTRRTLEALIEPYIERTLKACKQALQDAGVESVDRVVLVGGSTRTPAVAQAVAACFDQTPLCTLDPDQVVAMGAARQADILIGNRSDDDAFCWMSFPYPWGLKPMVD